MASSNLNSKLFRCHCVRPNLGSSALIKCFLQKEADRENKTVSAILFKRFGDSSTVRNLLKH